MNKNDIIKSLDLKLHPTEGGYYRRTYESELTITEKGVSRKLLTSIFYLLTDDSPHGFLHRNKSDIIHFYHLGAPMKYLIISPEGRLQEYIVGPDIAKGEQLQLVVRGGAWKVSELCSGEYGLISEAVAPGFVYEDSEIASIDKIRQLFPDLMSRLEQYIKRQ